jgi:hypothetical protein
MSYYTDHLNGHVLLQRSTEWSCLITQIPLNGHVLLQRSMNGHVLLHRSPEWSCLIK